MLLSCPGRLSYANRVCVSIPSRVPWCSGSELKSSGEGKPIHILLLTLMEYLEFFFFFGCSARAAFSISALQPGMTPEPRQCKHPALTTGLPGSELEFFFKPSLVVQVLRILERITCMFEKFLFV